MLDKKDNPLLLDPRVRWIKILSAICTTLGSIIIVFIIGMAISYGFSRLRSFVEFSIALLAFMLIVMIQIWINQTVNTGLQKNRLLRAALACFVLALLLLIFFSGAPGTMILGLELLILGGLCINVFYNPNPPHQNKET